MKAMLLTAVFVSIASSSDMTAQNASTAEPAATPTPTAPPVATPETPVARSLASPAPPAVYFLKQWASVKTQDSIRGFPPGTRLTVVGNFGDHLKVKAGDVEFEVKTNQVTNDPQIATQAAQTDVRQRQQNERRAAQLLEDAKATPTPDSADSGDRYVELKYHSPEQLAAAVHKAARSKMFSPEEEKNELAKNPAGGELEVILYSITIDTANPKRLTYVIGNSRGEVLERKQGQGNAPSNEGEFRWYGVDVIGLPAFNDELRVRIYHEDFGEMGDYIIPRNAQPKRVR